MTEKKDSIKNLISITRDFIGKHRELLIYGVVGALTTAVSWSASFVLKMFFNDQIAWQNLAINLLSWAAAISFAYPANRTWVFKSKNPNILLEMIRFVSSRLGTGITEIGLMSVMVNFLRINYWSSKLFVTIVVIITNYILSKLVVFKQKHE